MLTMITSLMWWYDNNHDYRLVLTLATQWQWTTWVTMIMPTIFSMMITMILILGWFILWPLSGSERHQRRRTWRRHHWRSHAHWLLTGCHHHHHLRNHHHLNQCHHIHNHHHHSHHHRCHHNHFFCHHHNCDLNFQFRRTGAMKRAEYMLSTKTKRWVNISKSFVSV